MWGGNIKSKVTDNCALSFNPVSIAYNLCWFDNMFDTLISLIPGSPRCDVKITISSSDNPTEDSVGNLWITANRKSLAYCKFKEYKCDACVCLYVCACVFYISPPKKLCYSYSIIPTWFERKKSTLCIHT
jgi:hypothetical protein